MTIDLCTRIKEYMWTTHANVDDAETAICNVDRLLGLNQK
jgi:hypothetical protein